MGGVVAVAVAVAVAVMMCVFLFGISVLAWLVGSCGRISTLCTVQVHGPARASVSQPGQAWASLGKQGWWLYFGLTAFCWTPPVQVDLSQPPPLSHHQPRPRPQRQSSLSAHSLSSQPNHHTIRPNCAGFKTPGTARPDFLFALYVYQRQLGFHLQNGVFRLGSNQWLGAAAGRTSQHQHQHQHHHGHHQQRPEPGHLASPEVPDFPSWHGRHGEHVQAHYPVHARQPPAVLRGNLRPTRELPGDWGMRLPPWLALPPQHDNLGSDIPCAAFCRCATLEPTAWVAACTPTTRSSAAPTSPPSSCASPPCAGATAILSISATSSSARARASPSRPCPARSSPIASATTSSKAAAPAWRSSSRSSSAIPSCRRAVKCWPPLFRVSHVFFKREREMSLTV